MFPARRTKLFRFRSSRGRKIWSEGDWKLWIIQWDDSVLININWFSFFSRARCFIWHFFGELRGFSIHEINERKTSLITFQKLVEIKRKPAWNIEDILTSSKKMHGHDFNSRTIVTRTMCLTQNVIQFPVQGRMNFIIIKTGFLIRTYNSN